MRALGCWINSEDRLRNVLLRGRYMSVPGPEALASRPGPCVVISTPRMRTKGRGKNVYLGEGFVHVPGYDSDFEEAMVQRGCLWVGSG